MGDKIITENDFWECSGGMMASPFQARQPIAKRQDGAKYITKDDVSTVSWVDFSCKKVMLLYAVVAAVAAAVAALCVATGGAALVAITVIGAAAVGGAGGAVLGAVVGTQICGQLVAPTRIWLSYKSDFKIQGIETITGGSKIVCTAFTYLGMSEENITFNPQIKSWDQAIKRGAANFMANILQGALTGMMIGAAFVALPAIIEGGIAAFVEGGAMNVVRFFGSNVMKNYAASWFTAEGLILRETMILQSELEGYGKRGYITKDDVTDGLLGLELGTAESLKNIASGSYNPLDYIGVALWFTPGPRMKSNEESRGGERETVENKNVENVNGVEGESNAGGKSEANAFEARNNFKMNPGEKLGDFGERVVKETIAEEGFTEVVDVQNNSGQGVDILARNPETGAVKSIEVKTTQQEALWDNGKMKKIPFQGDQTKGGEIYTNERLNEAASGKGRNAHPPELKDNASKAQDMIKEAESQGIMEYEYKDVYVDQDGNVIGINQGKW